MGFNSGFKGLIYWLEQNTEAVVVTSKETGLQVNAEKN